MAWRGWPGAGLVGGIGLASYWLAQYAWLQRFGIGALSLAILAGLVLGNVFPALAGERFRPGLLLAQRRFLRSGVALYGFNLSVQQIVEVGATGVLVDLFMVVSTLLVGWAVGRRLLGMDRETVLLASAGSAICGAAAVVATLPMLRSDTQAAAEKGAVAVATVVLFGTLAMGLYPLLYRLLGPSHFDFGVYVGSTVHEVAQVVAIGSTLGEEVARSAVIAKMIRVMLLVPFLLLVGNFAGGRAAGGRLQPLAVPWFALAFVALAGVNSLAFVPPPLVEALRLAGLLLLAAAMAALGLDTRLGRLGRAGVRPLLLGAALFLHLVVVGGLINWFAGA